MLDGSILSFRLLPAFWYLFPREKSARVLQTLPHPRCIDVFPSFGSEIQYVAPIHPSYQWNIPPYFLVKNANICLFLLIYIILV